MQRWRDKGPLGKLHNTVVYIQRSPQRREAFADLSTKRLGLIRDNSTRWNSWYAMLKRALQCQTAVEVYCSKYSKFLHEGDICKLNY
jgi:hypothetical protein